jgi:hypothetical protein
MKPKDYCQECGRYICRKKLKPSPKDKRLLCKNCFKKENGIRYVEEPIVPGMTNSMANKKKVNGGAKMGRKYSYVIKGEEEIMKKKYGKKYFGQFKKLKNALGITRMKMITDNSESIDRQKREKNLNERFKESFK